MTVVTIITYYQFSNSFQFVYSYLIFLVIVSKLLTPLTIGWSNELTIEILDLYEGESGIWNIKHHHHKNRNQVYDSWKRIENKIRIECSFKEPKRTNKI